MMLLSPQYGTKSEIVQLAQTAVEDLNTLLAMPCALDNNLIKQASVIAKIILCLLQNSGEREPILSYLAKLNTIAIDLGNKFGNDKKLIRTELNHFFDAVFSLNLPFELANKSANNTEALLNSQIKLTLMFIKFGDSKYIEKIKYFTLIICNKLYESIQLCTDTAKLPMLCDQLLEWQHQLIGQGEIRFINDTYLEPLFLPNLEMRTVYMGIVDMGMAKFHMAKDINLAVKFALRALDKLTIADSKSIAIAYELQMRLLNQKRHRDAFLLSEKLVKHLSMKERVYYHPSIKTNFADLKSKLLLQLPQLSCDASAENHATLKSKKYTFVDLHFSAEKNCLKVIFPDFLDPRALNKALGLLRKDNTVVVRPSHHDILLYKIGEYDPAVLFTLLDTIEHEAIKQPLTECLSKLRKIKSETITAVRALPVRNADFITIDVNSEMESLEIKSTPKTKVKRTEKKKELPLVVVQKPLMSTPLTAKSLGFIVKGADFRVYNISSDVIPLGKLFSYGIELDNPTESITADLLKAYQAILEEGQIVTRGRRGLRIVKEKEIGEKREDKVFKLAHPGYDLRILMYAEQKITDAAGQTKYLYRAGTAKFHKNKK